MCTTPKLNIVVRFSTNLPSFYSEYDEDGNVQVCSLPTFSGEFHCNDPNLVPKSQVDDVTCTLNVSHYVSGEPADKLFNDSNGEFDWVKVDSKPCRKVLQPSNLTELCYLKAVIFKFHLRQECFVFSLKACL